jgi:hypothetical protein
VLGIGVSGDGTWRKRGFSSYHGVSSLISIVSGTIIDVEVKSSLCHACSLWENKKGTVAYRQWLARHSPVRERNFTGTPGSMESVSACR